MDHLAKMGEVDQVVDLLGRRPETVNAEDCWPAVYELVKLIVKSNLQEGGLNDLHEFGQLFRPDRLPKSNILTVKRMEAWPFEQTDVGHHAFFVNADIIKLGASNIVPVVVVSTGATKLQGFHKSILMSLGPVDVKSAYKCIIVSDNSVSLRSTFDNSLVIARGTISLERSALASTLVSQEDVILGKGLVGVDSCTIRKKTLHPATLIRFFEPRNLGIDAIAVQNGLRISYIDRDKLFHAAGLRLGDIIQSLDGIPLDSAESFRKVLRPKAALGEATIVQLRRADQNIQIEVEVK